MGTLTDDAEKTIYVGNWEHGEKEGQGTITYGDGARYEGTALANPLTVTLRLLSPPLLFLLLMGSSGQWKQGKRHGKGTMHLANGDRFVGLFRTGKVTTCISNLGHCASPCLSLPRITTTATATAALPHGCCSSTGRACTRTRTARSSRVHGKRVREKATSYSCCPA